MASAPTLTPAQRAQQAAANNINIRNMLLNNCPDMFQQIYSAGIDPTKQTQVNIPVKNVGAIRGFLVKVSGTVHNSDGALDGTLTPPGASNVLSNIQFTDFTNLVRINTTGWHLSLLNSAKQPLTFGGVYSPNLPVGYGNNWTVFQATSPLAHGEDGTIQYYYWVPITYSRTDLRGIMWAGLNNAAAYLQLTINTALGVAAGGGTAADPLNAVYAGTASITWKSGTLVTITVWQDYLDQVPLVKDANGQPQPLLPQQDQSQFYELKNTVLSPIVVNNPFLITYANYRVFYSTTVVFDNAGVLNTGSDVSNWQMITANTTQQFFKGPSEAALFARNTFHADPPAGFYYFSHRDAPISTQNYGNQALQLTASAVTAGAYAAVGFEAFANLTQVGYASSLPNS